MKKLILLLMAVLLPMTACNGNKDKDEDYNVSFQLSEVMDVIKQDIDLVKSEALFHSELATEQETYKTNEGDIITIYVFDIGKKEEGALEIHNNFMNMNFGESLIKHSKGNVEVIFIKANNEEFEIENKLTKAIGHM
ncbi:hypothetical protein [Paenibacillus prosopidis]|uniref:Lipoprotein n=1 Tax=Paenibacillus prosopidis TaxID=630520 RepID=A0A368VL02_9BACL|nr:hypothetical protein [Paenibacillus prosopidis]RCW40345.1 hypothetical protein DFP97_1357 [Paenibacillus prosopidis]